MAWCQLNLPGRSVSRGSGRATRPDGVERLPPRQLPLPGQSNVREWCSGSTHGLGPCGRGSSPRSLTILRSFSGRMLPCHGSGGGPTPPRSTNGPVAELAYASASDTDAHTGLEVQLLSGPPSPPYPNGRGSRLKPGPVKVRVLRGAPSPAWSNGRACDVHIVEVGVQLPQRVPHTGA